MFSLSVNRWGFTDKLFKMNKLSVKRAVFRTNQNFQHQGLHQPHYFLDNLTALKRFAGSNPAASALQYNIITLLEAFRIRKCFIVHKTLTNTFYYFL